VAPQRAWVGAQHAAGLGVSPDRSTLPHWLPNIPASFPQVVFQPHELVPFYLWQLLAAQGSLYTWCWPDSGCAAAVYQRTPTTMASPSMGQRWDFELNKKPCAEHCCRQQGCLVINVIFLITVRPRQRATTWKTLLVLAQGEVQEEFAYEGFFSFFSRAGS